MPLPANVRRHRHELRRETPAAEIFLHNQNFLLVAQRAGVERIRERGDFGEILGVEKLCGRRRRFPEHILGELPGFQTVLQATRASLRNEPLPFRRASGKKARARRHVTDRP